LETVASPALAMARVRILESECYSVAAVSTWSELNRLKVRYRVFLRILPSLNPPLETDHHQNVYFESPDIVSIGLNTLLKPHHPLEKKRGQARLHERPQNALDRR
jgi:hypothetical protein